MDWTVIRIKGGRPGRQLDQSPAVGERRGTAATALHKACLGARAIADQLGHARVPMTQNRYQAPAAFPVSQRYRDLEQRQSGASDPEWRWAPWDSNRQPAESSGESAPSR